MFLGPLRLPLSFPRGLRRLHRLDAGDGCLKLVGDPGIEALAGNACRQIDLAMKLRRNAGMGRNRAVVEGNPHKGAQPVAGGQPEGPSVQRAGEAPDAVCGGVPKARRVFSGNGGAGLLFPACQSGRKC